MGNYKIKDLEILTGVKAHTLRIWEKRYNFIKPERTDSQIRTYTDEELVTLLNVALLNKNGIKISKIADMSELQIAEKIVHLKSIDLPEVSQEKLLLSLIELDELLFKNTLQDLFNLYGLEKTFSDHLVPFLERIGVMWLVGSINPAQEHFISNLIRQKLISQIDALDIPSAEQPAVMLFLPEHEWHEIGLLFYQYALRKKHIRTIYLGQSVPYDSLLTALEKIKPKAIVSSWLTAVDSQFLVNYLQQLDKDSGQLPHWSGGFQINSNISKVKSYITEIKELSDLDTLEEVLR